MVVTILMLTSQSWKLKYACIRSGVWCGVVYVVAVLCSVVCGVMCGVMWCSVLKCGVWCGVCGVYSLNVEQLMFLEHVQL